MTQPDPAQALLRERELRALTVLTVVRGVTIVVFFVMALAIGFSAFERVAVSVLTVLYCLALAFSVAMIRRGTRLAFVGFLGAGLDAIVVAVLPAIWYQSVGGIEVAPAYMLQTGLPTIAILFIVLYSLALRPAYPILVAVGAVAVHLGYFSFVMGDSRTVLTSNYVDHAMGPHLHGGLFTGTLVVIVGVGAILAILTWATRRLVFEAVHLEKANTQLGRYFSPNLVRRLVENPSLFRLGGERRELSFVFTDLAGFTSLVEQQEPARIVPLLNEYLDGMVNIVFKHEGTVDKVVGDAVHAIFGAPTEQPDHAARAVACALEMDAFARRFAEDKRKEGVPFGGTRIGVNTGTVVVGNFGGESMFDYTAHGDAINTAARLESLNKHLGTRVIVSADVARQILDFKGRPVGKVILEGKSEGLEVLEPLSAQRADSSAIASYEEAFRLLEAGDPDAEAAFEALAGPPAPDPLAAFHLNRLRAGESGSTIVMAVK